MSASPPRGSQRKADAVSAAVQKGAAPGIYEVLVCVVVREPMTIRVASGVFYTKSEVPANVTHVGRLSPSSNLGNAHLPNVLSRRLSRQSGPVSYPCPCMFRIVP